MFFGQGFAGPINLIPSANEIFNKLMPRSTHGVNFEMNTLMHIIMTR